MVVIGGGIIGTGIANLLTLIDELGSIRAAAGRMKMSYRRAWDAIRTLESNLGFNVIERTIGGARGGGSVLTSDGRVLVKQYQTLDRSIKAFSKKEFHARFQKHLAFKRRPEK